MEKIKILGMEEIPLYENIKVIDGAFVYGEEVGTYTIVKTHHSHYNEPLVAILNTDDSMSSDDPQNSIPKDYFILGEMDTPVRKGNLGIFSYNGECIVRRLKVSGKNAVLEAFNKSYSDISVEDEDEFYILAKVIEASRNF